MDIVTYYVLPIVGVIGGLCILAKMIEYVVWSFIENNKFD